MAFPSSPRLGLGLLLAVTARGFTPFAGVEELKPHRIAEHCEPGSGNSKLRWCSRSFQTTLEDGGDVQLDWRMNVDPDSILSLDTEAEHGVRLHRCGPRELHLELPESHAAHAAEGKYVVASRFVHNCAHLLERHLYHRVVGIHRHEWRRHPEGHRTAHVHLFTTELASFAHVVPSLSFSFSYVPVEAMGNDPFPEMRTDFGLNRQHRGSALGRQLQAEPQTTTSSKNKSGSTFGKWLSKMSDTFKNVDGVTQEDGGLEEKGPFFTKSVKSSNSILNFAPKQVSNFGWNWNFAMNTSEKPEFNVTMPGTRGWARVYNPFVRIHSGIFLNFSSEFREITEIPIVRWKAGMKGKGEVRGRVLAWLNTTSAAGVDPFKTFNLSILEQYAIPRWFQKIDLATGSMPLSLEPGFQFKAEMYHQGDFKGAVGLGGHTQGPFDAWVSYDSDVGFDSYWNVRLTNTTFWPPIWLIFTREFEMGVKFRPSILMRGDFADLEKATMAIEMEHYMNVTVTRERNASAAPANQLKPLVVYPVRVMGLPPSDFQKRYKVQVLANGHSVETSPVINWGQVSFRDHIEKFKIGSIPQAAVTQEDLIAVTLMEVDASGQETVLGTGGVRCTSMLNGECHPSPSLAYIKSGGTEVAAVELEVVWDSSYAHRLASHIRGLALSIPQVNVKSNVANVMMGANVSEPSDKFSIHLLHSGREYTWHLNAAAGGGPGSDDLTFFGDTTWEFEANFIETWTQCPKSSSSKCESPTLELYFGNKLMASNQIPQVEWTSPGAMRGTVKSRRGSMDVPVTVALNDPKTSETLAVVKLNAQILAIAASSTFMVPNGAKEVPLGGDEFLVWTVSNVVKDQDYIFSLQALKLVDDTSSTFHDLKVGDKALVPVPGTTVKSQGPCHPVALKGMTAQDSPCNFQQHFSFPAAKFKAGDVVVILLRWNLTSDGTTHALWSPPLQVVDESTEGAKSGDQTAVAAKSRRLGTGKAYLTAANKIMKKHQKNCNTRNLQFRLGGGLLVRGKVSSLTLPKGFPMVGGLDEAPQLATRWRKITNMKPTGTDMQRLAGGDGSLPCQVGLCSGMLPGCQGFRFNRTTIPVIHLHGARKFHFQNKTGQKWTFFKGMLAYAFSTLPESVNIVIKDLNETGNLPGATTTTTMVPILGPGTELGSGGSQTQEPVVLSVTTSNKPADPKAFWPWDDGRRLGVEAEETSRAAPSDVMTVTFKEPLPYHLDDDHMQLLLDAGYFSGLEDEAGTVDLVGFSLQHREPAPGSASISAVELPRHVEDRNLRAVQTSASKVGLVVIIGILGLAVIISFRLSSRRVSASPQPGALE